MTFPEGFRFGAGMSDVAADGAPPASDLGRWQQEGRAGRPDPGAELATHFTEDVHRLSAHGITDLRLTLPWARLEPTNGHWDSEAIEHQRLVLQAACDAGITVWGCLHDGALPGWFAHDERGFADAKSRRYHWARHTEFVGETFGDLVGGWLPVFEPSRWAYRATITGEAPPGRVGDAEAFAAHLEAVHQASVEAALRLRGAGLPVASAQWVVPLFAARADPDTPPTPEAEAMTSVVDEALWGCWQRMLDEETLQVPGRGPVEVPGAREAFDLIGITYRHAAAVRADGVLLPYPQQLATGVDGQVPWPHGLDLALHHVAESLPERSLLVAGYGLATANEDQRTEHLRAGLTAAEAAIDGGIDLRGFWWDTPFDGASDHSHRGLFASDRAALPAAEVLAATETGSTTPG